MNIAKKASPEKLLYHGNQDTKYLRSYRHDSSITRPNCALDRSTILCLYVPGFQRLTFKHIYYFLMWIPQTVPDSANIAADSTNFVADSANMPVFEAILCSTVFQLFVCGIQNSKEDQRKVTMLWIPRQI